MTMHATVVEAGYETVGLAVRSEAGFRFFASKRDLQHLEGAYFRSMAELDRAVRSVTTGTSLES